MKSATAFEKEVSFAADERSNFTVDRPVAVRKSMSRIVEHEHLKSMRKERKETCAYPWYI